ncbi:MAG: ATP-binding protein [Acidimicrobiales bacterium]
MLVGRAGLSPVMVGREADLGRLRSLFAASPVPTIALIAGEAGIGKTRLVQELVASAPPGTLVLAGQADPGTVGRPMELFLDALGKRLGPAHDDLAEVVRDPDRAADERVRAGVELVDALADGGPGLVVFEDLHWADAESLSVFELLAEPDRGPLVLVGTYRPDGLSRRHPAADLLPRLDRRHLVTHVPLGRLAPAEVNDFLAAVFEEEPPYRAVEALHTRTGGNPFFLEELVAGAGDVRTDDLATAPLPWTVAEAVRRQVDGLDPGVRAVVSAMSVLGRRVAFDLLAAVTKEDEAVLIDHLRTAVDSGLVVEADADVFSFHHDLAREAIEGGLLGRERRRLHEAALDAMRAEGSHDHVALTHHAQGAGRYDEMVAEARLGAEASVRLGSTYQALQLAETGLCEAEDDLDLRALATEAAALVGLLDDAADHGDQWLAHARARGDVAHEARALSLRMRIAYDVGDLPAMARFTDELIATIDQVDGDEDRARAMTFVAQSHRLLDRVALTCEWADKALDIATSAGFDAVRLAAMVEKGSALTVGPDTVVEGRALLEAAAEEAARTGDDALAAQALEPLVWLARVTSRLDDARELLERMRKHAEVAGFDRLATYARVEAAASLAAADGDLDAALEILEQRRRDDPRTTSARNRRWLSVLRAGLALEAGELRAAAELTEAAKPVTPRSQVGVLGLELHLAAREGDLASARESLKALLPAIAEEGYAAPSQVHDLVAGCLAGGMEPAELLPLVELMGVIPTHRIELDHPFRQLIDAQLAEGGGDLEAAARLFAAAADSSTDIAYGLLPRHRGSAHVGAARTLIGLGRLDEALPHAEAAARLLSRWRGWRVAELVSVQRRLGIGAEPSGPAELTPREREVAALLAEGLSNAGLAERLYISPRTAAVHVSNILAKLGMASRTEVAAWAAREGLASSS